LASLPRKLKKKSSNEMNLKSSNEMNFPRWQPGTGYFTAGSLALDTLVAMPGFFTVSIEEVSADVGEEIAIHDHQKVCNTIF
jgi:hypothetical protein